MTLFQLETQILEIDIANSTINVVKDTFVGGHSDGRLVTILHPHINKWQSSVRKLLTY